MKYLIEFPILLKIKKNNNFSEAYLITHLIMWNIWIFVIFQFIFYVNGCKNKNATNESIVYLVEYSICCGSDNRIL